MAVSARAADRAAVYVSHDADFHRELLAASGNQMLIGLAGLVGDALVSPAARRLNTLCTSTGMILALHGDVVAAIQSGTLRPRNLPPAQSSPRTRHDGLDHPVSAGPSNAAGDRMTSHHHPAKPETRMTHDNEHQQPVLVIMGVSGTGKSTVAAILAGQLGWDLEEGDDLHPAGERRQDGIRATADRR